MLKLAIFGLILAHAVLGCTVVNDNMLGRLQTNEDRQGEAMFVLEGNQVGEDKFTAHRQELTFSVHSRGQQGMRGVVVKTDTERGCGIVTPTADGAEPLPDCPGGISSTGEPKRHFVFGVKAPQCGCITIRAMVVGMDRHVYGEDEDFKNGLLTKTICLNSGSVNKPKVVIELPIDQKPVEIPPSSTESSSEESITASSNSHDNGYEPYYEPADVEEDERFGNDDSKDTAIVGYDEDISDLDEDEEAEELKNEENEPTEELAEKVVHGSRSQRDVLCQRYDRFHGGNRWKGRGHGHGRQWRGRRGGRAGRRGRRVFKRAVKGGRGRYHVIVVQQQQQEPQPLVPREVPQESFRKDPIGRDWRFRRAIIRECCPMSADRFSGCYESMVTERASNLGNKPNRPGRGIVTVDDEPDVEPIVDDETELYEQNKPVVQAYDTEKDDDVEDPDYVPTDDEIAQAEEDEEIYDENELIDSKEVDDLIADANELETTEDNDEGLECAHEGRRGRGKCLMRECCSKGKKLGKTHRGRLWKKCVAGSKAVTFKQIVTRRKKHKCRVVFRHCCIAAGRKERMETTRPVVEEEKSDEQETSRQTTADSGYEITTDEESPETNNIQISSSTIQQERQIRYFDSCCAAGARVAQPRDLGKCRREARALTTGSDRNIFLRRKCHQKFIRCCLIRTSSGEENVEQ